MAAFSNPNHPFLIDPIFLPNTFAFSQEPNNIISPSPCFPQFFPPESYYDEAPVTNHNNSADSSSVVNHKAESGEQVTQTVVSMANKRSTSDGSSLSSAQSVEAREMKGKKQKKCDGVGKDDKEKKPSKAGKKDQKIKGAEEVVQTDYVHVRARRGQATDSHSLAERVRREKISERMKMLQGLVPGCDQMTGKALILDEIINYVQSLQNQVEFLSMKLGSVNSMFSDFGMELDAFLDTPDERLNSLESPLQNGQQCNPGQPLGFPHSPTNTFTSPPNTYPLVDNISSLLFDQQVQFPNTMQPQDNGQLLWNVDEQRQKHINQSGFISNNLCSFN